jgi:O-antigen biosynthesis protein
MRFRSGYFLDSKPALLDLFDPSGLRILDAGCAGGGNGALMKRAGAREVVGIEMDAGAAGKARERLDTVLLGDLAEVDLAPIAGRPFDAVLLIDVLEHLVDPVATLCRMTALLKPGGLVVASLPNVAHVWVIANLLAKRWPQKDRGIFDRTHVRFFAKRDMIALLRSADLEIVCVKPYFTRFRLLRAIALALSLYVFRDYYARQFLLVGRKPAA